MSLSYLTNDTDCPGSYAACRDSWGIERLTKKARERVEALIGSRATRTVRTPTRAFLWRPNQVPSQYAGFRVNADPKASRDAEHVPPEEVATAMAGLLQSHFSMSEDDLLRAAAEVFGFMRLGSKVRTSMQEGLEMLITTNRGVLKDGQVLQPEAVAL